MDPGPEPPRLRTSSREAAGAGTHRALSKGQKLGLVEPLDPADHGQRTQRAEVKENVVLMCEQIENLNRYVEFFFF